MTGEKDRRPVAVITGASAGIGRAAAVAFAQRGWAVALLARGDDGLQGAQRDVERAGGRALALGVDVADCEAVERAADRVEAELGPIDVWVNNAMATIFCDFANVAPADFKRATEVTYLGAVWGTRAALAHMKRRGRGAIVQVGSALAYRSIPLQSAYCGAKAALRGFTDSLRSELIYQRSAIHLTMVHLSAFNTPQFDWGRTCMQGKPRPLGTIFQPELAGEAIFWASQHRRRELWVGFPAVQAILGTRVLPGYLDRKLANEAYGGQQSEEPVAPDRRDNLYEPVPGDHGIEGRFSHKARSHSAQYWATTHPWTIAAAALPLLGAVMYLVSRR